MSRGAQDIEWLQLFIGYIPLAIPLFVLLYFRTGLAMTALIAMVRMTLQLILVGVYLNYIFELNNAFLNIAWLLAMIVIASGTIVKRSEMRARYFMFPVFVAVMMGIGFTGGVMLNGVLLLEDPFEARYLIPIGGMILGNCLGSSIIGLRSFFGELLKSDESYRYDLACGASRHEALNPFIREALKNAFNPSIATMATMGLISLPGMMTGQILGGSDPLTAIKYQILIMIAIFTGTVITVIAGIIVSARFAFDDFDMIKKGLFRKSS